MMRCALVTKRVADAPRDVELPPIRGTVRDEATGRAAADSTSANPFVHRLSSRKDRGGAFRVGKARTCTARASVQIEVSWAGRQNSSCCGKSSPIVNQGAFEPTKMCFDGVTLGVSNSEPSARCTVLPSPTTE